MDSQSHKARPRSEILTRDSLHFKLIKIDLGLSIGPSAKSTEHVDICKQLNSKTKAQSTPGLLIHRHDSPLPINQSGFLDEVVEFEHATNETKAYREDDKASSNDQLSNNPNGSFGSIVGSTVNPNEWLDSENRLLQISTTTTTTKYDGILPNQRPRAFYGREWVFEKILRYLRSSIGQAVASPTLEPSAESDTITEKRTVSSVLPTDAQPISNVRSKARHVVIVGGPGSGKSTICWRIGKSMHEAHKFIRSGDSLQPAPLSVQVASKVLCVHSCSTRLIVTTNPATFVQSVHEQILRSPLSIAARYAELFTRDSLKNSDWLKEEQISASPEQAFRYGVLATLNQIPTKWSASTNQQDCSQVGLNTSHLILLIDGLDEWDGFSSPGNSAAVTASQSNETASLRPTNAILELLRNTIQSFPDWLCLITTCQRQNRNLFSQMFPTIKRLTIDDLHRTAVGQDVHQYLLSRLAAEEALQHALQDHMQSDVLSLLRIKSSACLLYLETLLDALSDGWIRPDRLNSIPGTLNGLFLWLCQQIFTQSEDASDQCSSFTYLRSLLNVLLASPHTLTETDLYTILSSTDSDLSWSEFHELIQQLQHVLVTRTHDQEALQFGINATSWSNNPTTPGMDYFNVGTAKRIHFFHPSFAEWLLDVKHCTPVYLCNKQHGIELITQAFRSVNGTMHEGSKTPDTGYDQSDLDQHMPPLPKQKEFCLGVNVEYRTMGLEPTESTCTDELDHTIRCPEPETSGAIRESGDHGGRIPPDESIVLAARRGDLGKIQILLEASSNVDRLDEDDWSALRTAAWRGHVDAVTLLLRHGASVNLSGPDGRSALRAAAWAGHEEIVQQLLDAGAQVDLQDAEGRTPLLAAAYMGHVNVVELLAHAGANLNHSDEDGRTALHVAAFCVAPSDAHHKVVAALLECGANPTLYDSEGVTPLLGAARLGNHSVCELCLEADTDVNQMDKCSNSALMLAVRGGHTAVVRLLLFWGAAVDAMDTAGRSLLSLAASIGSGSIVQELLARGLDEAHRDHAGRTPLHLAAAGQCSAVLAQCDTEATAEQYADVIRILLDSGANPGDVDNSGRTALLIACETNQLEAVGPLLSHHSAASSNFYQTPSRSDTASASSSDHRPPPCPTKRVTTAPTVANVPTIPTDSLSLINRPSMDGQTPLRAAATIACNPELVRLLLSAGADPDSQDAYGRTTLYLLALEGTLDMVDILLHTPSPGAHSRLGSVAVVGANPVLADDEGRCPLHVATWQGHLAMIRLLLQAGTPVDIRDREGRTPLQLAAWQGHTNICQLLLHEGSARVDAVCSQGATSLCIAAQEGHRDVCSVLLQAGANPFQADNHGRTPYRVALKAGHFDICELLERSYEMNPSEWFPPRPEAHRASTPSSSVQMSELPPLPPTPPEPKHSAHPRAMPHYRPSTDRHRSHTPETAHQHQPGMNAQHPSAPVWHSSRNDSTSMGSGASSSVGQQQQLMENSAETNPYARPPGPLALLRQSHPHRIRSNYHAVPMTQSVMTHSGPHMDGQLAGLPDAMVSVAPTAHMNSAIPHDFPIMGLGWPRDQSTAMHAMQNIHPRHNGSHRLPPDVHQSNHQASRMSSPPMLHQMQPPSPSMHQMRSRISVTSHAMPHPSPAIPVQSRHVQAGQIRGPRSNQFNPHLQQNNAIQPLQRVPFYAQHAIRDLDPQSADPHPHGLFPDLLSHQYPPNGCQNDIPRCEGAGKPGVVPMLSPSVTGRLSNDNDSVTNVSNPRKNSDGMTSIPTLFPEHRVVSPTKRREKPLNRLIDTTNPLPVVADNVKMHANSPQPVLRTRDASPSLSKFPLTKSALAGMFGFSGRRLKKSGRKVPSTEANPPTPPMHMQSDPSARLPVKLRSPYLRAMQPEGDYRVDLSAKTRLGPTGYRLSTVSGSSDPKANRAPSGLPLDRSSLRNESPSPSTRGSIFDGTERSGSTQLEAIARRLACCSNFEGLPHSGEEQSSVASLVKPRRTPSHSYNTAVCPDPRSPPKK